MKKSFVVIFTVILAGGISGCGARSGTGISKETGGAVIGGIAGNAAGKAVGKQQGYAYIVRFSTGDVKEIIQGADVYIAPGTPVDIIAGADGWKLVPAGGY